MAEKKNQHYVPQMYLRLFSTNKDGARIGMFHLAKELYRAAIPLKHQAKEDFFYGRDGELEDGLSKLEMKTAPFLKAVISLSQIPPKNKEAYGWILLFTIILVNRTKDAVEKIKEASSKMINEIMKHDDRVKDKAGKYFIFPKDAAAMSVLSTTSQIHLATDLKMKLLINKTDLKFITSDHPVIRYNQFLEKREHPGGIVGLATKGLQIFFPISPEHMLCYYDDWIYKIGDRAQEVISINNRSDVDKLNYLQILNCHDHLYFNEAVPEHYIKDLYHRAKGKRIKEYSVFETTHSYFDAEGQEHIHYHSYGQDLKIKLDLSFITQTKKAKHHILSDYAVQLRNESLREGNGS